jgi:hypothetical protein
VSGGFLFGQPSGMDDEKWARLRELWSEASAESTRELVAELEDAWGGRVVLDGGSLFVGIAVADLSAKGWNLPLMLRQSESTAADLARTVDLVRGLVTPALAPEPAAGTDPAYRRALLEVSRVLGGAGPVDAGAAAAARTLIRDALYPGAGREAG